MSQSTSEVVSAAAAGVAPAAGGTRRMLLVVLPALVAGAALGGFVVAPRLVAKSSGPATVVAKPAVTKPGESVPVFRIDNVIVNPAGSQGQRYLVVSVGIAVDDPKVEIVLHNAEVQIRDAITGALERQSMDLLTRPGARDSVRVALTNVVKPFLDGATARIYIPQFLIQ